MTLASSLDPNDGPTQTVVQVEQELQAELEAAKQKILDLLSKGPVATTRLFGGESEPTEGFESLEPAVLSAAAMRLMDMHQIVMRPGGYLHEVKHSLSI